MSNIMILPNKHLVIEGARLIYRNFAGKGSDYNAQGDRNFCVVIDDAEMAEQLKADGWNVKERISSVDPDAVFHYIKVKCSYRIQAPRVQMMDSRSVTELVEENIGILDGASIANADIEISPSRWEMRGKTGVTGYLSALYVTIQEDYFASKYGQQEAADEDMPF